MRIKKNSTLKLIEKIKLQRQSSEKKIKLKYGYKIVLSKQELLDAKKINSLYESMVWGTVDDADNQSISSEEKKIIQRWIKDSIYGQDVLEVGCGSGRFTFHLSKLAKKVTALDREQDTLNALQDKKQINKAKNINCLCLDFSKKIGLKNRFTSIFMIENLLGMNPRFLERKQIILNAEKALLKDGLLFVGFRVHPDAGKKYFYQSMPYQDLMGIAINWSEQHLIKEFKQTSKSLKHKLTIEGTKRPAGGKMYIAIFEKK
jgi:ubiquinone/menaquinone biosynthesis C-methylase UbiE